MTNDGISELLRLDSSLSRILCNSSSNPNGNCDIPRAVTGGHATFLYVATYPLPRFVEAIQDMRERLQRLL